MSSGKTDEIEVYWSYTPKDFFEEPIEKACGCCSVKMENGRIVCSTTGEYFDSNPDLRDRLTRKLYAYFRAANLVRRTSFEISGGGGYNRKGPEGEIHSVLMVDSASIGVTTGNVDLVVTKADGTVRRDTRQERLDRTAELAELSAQHATDAIAAQILESYNNSIDDADNELVHLYEIWETLRANLPRRQALSAIGVARQQMSLLTRLANDEPLKQGRHRGKHAGSLRDATAAELQDARDVATQMIVGYLRSLISPD